MTETKTEETNAAPVEDAKVGITTTTLNNVLKYLGQKPYVETAQLIKMIMMEVQQAPNATIVPKEQTTLDDHDIEDKSNEEKQNE